MHRRLLLIALGLAVGNFLLPAQEPALTISTNAPAAAPSGPATNSPASATAAMPDPNVVGRTLLRQAFKESAEGKAADALQHVNGALQLLPKEPGAFNLRGSIYLQQQQYDLAEQSYKSALLNMSSDDPMRPMVGFNLAQVKFAQKDYFTARPGFLAIQDDKNYGDLARYKVYLCDLLGGHTADAAKELDAFNQVGSNPSFYFANAANALVNKRTEAARGWLASASGIYSPQKFLIYSDSLRKLGYLPLPDPPTP